MEKKINDMQYKKRFRYSKQQDEYTLRLKKKRNYWWLLLLLLPLLLFIRMSHDITVKTIDGNTGIAMADIPVTMDYTPHLLPIPFVEDSIPPHPVTQTTDSTGTTVFKDIRCCVFSYLFYTLSKAQFTITTKCFDLDPNPTEKAYHWTWKVNLKLVTKREDVKLTIKDKEQDYPLANAKVLYKWVESGKLHTDTVSSDENGVAVVKGFPSCGLFDTIAVSCYGYADTLIHKKPSATLRLSADSATIRLAPLKKSFSYYVKNRESGQPIPGATCVVTLTDQKKNTVRGTSTTNVDGLGKGVFNDAFVLAHVDITASKPRFKDGKLEGDYTVEQFIALPDSQRVIYLDPEDFVQEFQNVDSLTGKPIPGVTNEITVTDLNGKKQPTYTEISNKNGMFNVKAKEGYKIEIVSKLEPEYLVKHTLIAKFENSDKIIKMVRDMVDIEFRTVDDETNELVPNCTLEITGSLSGRHQPQNSGNGAFTVKGLFKGESVSIISSKKDYYTNDTKIKNSNVVYLMKASQEERDIPMILDLPPCNLHPQSYSGGAGTKIMSFNLYKRKGTLKFQYQTGTHFPDEIKIYNCAEADIAKNKPIWQTFQAGHIPGPVIVPDLTEVSVPFNFPIITVVVYSPQDDTVWDFIPECPK